MKIRLVRAEFFPCGRTDRHDEANSHFSQFCENAWKVVVTQQWLLTIMDRGNQVAGPTVLCKTFSSLPSLPGKVRTPSATSSYLLPQNPIGSLCSVTDYKANNQVRWSGQLHLNQVIWIPLLYRKSSATKRGQSRTAPRGRDVCFENFKGNYVILNYFLLCTYNISRHHSNQNVGQ